MSETDHLPFLHDRRLADLASAPLPAWLWANDATRILWANAVGAATFGAPAVAALTERRFDLKHPAAQQVARLADSLPERAPRLERLRGFASGVGRLLTANCRRLDLADGTPAILIAATEPAGPSLTLTERVRRLFAGQDLPFAAFSPDGALLHAGPEASRRLGGAATLAAAGAQELAETALAQGRADGDTPVGAVTLQRIGSGNALVLVAIFAPEPRTVDEPAQTHSAKPDVVAPADHSASEQAIEPAAAETLASEGALVGALAATKPSAQVEMVPVREVIADEKPGDGNAPTGAAPSVFAHETALAPQRTIMRDAPAGAERRQPLRFVWQIDAEGRFTVASHDFVEVMGSGVAAVVGRPWAEVAAELTLDPEGRLGQALAARDTFSGVAITWPVAGTSERLAAELSGLPVFDRDRIFRGYRGFGVCRDAARIAEIVAARRMPFVAPVETSVATKELRVEEATWSVQPAADTTATHDPPVEAEDASPPAPAPETAETPPPVPDRPQLTVVPPAKNVVPFRPAPPLAADKRPALTPVERTAFHEIARALGARVEGAAPTEVDATSNQDAAEHLPSDVAPEAAEPAAAATPAGPADEPGETPGGDAKRSNASHRVWPRRIPSAYAAGAQSAELRMAAQGNGERAVLDRLPIGVLVYRGEALLHANRALLEWTGYEDIEAVAAAGGLERLFVEPGLALLGEPGGSGQSLAITTRRGESLPVEARLFSVSWHGGTALLIVLVRAEAEERVRAAEDAQRAGEGRVKAAEAALAASEERLKTAELASRAAQAVTRELESVLETATDGIIVVDHDGMILSSNRSAEALFGCESREIANRSFVDLFAPESHRAAHDYLDGLTRDGVARVLNDGREVNGRAHQGGLIPLFMTIGRIADGKFCIVFRDITQWKRAEEDLTNAKREAEKASSAKTDFLAKVSHEIRTPLNAIIGFAEVMADERFGPIGNERYRQYLNDIRTSGELVISLVNDLLDLSKIEAGKLELTFASVTLNALVQQCVAIMQPQANRERIIIRTSLLPTLPPVVADERSIRQIVLNLLSNSIKFTGAGGQVIVSTALTDQGQAVMRVRDTGVGMNEKEIETALEPFRQVAASGRAGSGTGLGLPLTKALAEANRASFTIKSAIDSGTLVEVAFPPTRVLAE
jgi:PAS domain S-box-containing protein